MYALGILAALAAVLGWGLGDFFVQRAAHAVGIGQSMFVVSCVGFVFWSVFAIPRFGILEATPTLIWLLLATALTILLSATLNYLALGAGKLAIVEPIFGLELPITIVLAVGLHHEPLTLALGVAGTAVFLGTVLASTKRFPRHDHRRLLERGTWFALAGACLFALGNFLVGLSSQEASPFLSLWFTAFIIMLASGIYVLSHPRRRAGLMEVRRHPRMLVGVFFFNLLAVAGFSFATTWIPISIATTVSESYIAFGTLLGLVVNRERLRRHQYLGIALAIVGVLILSWVHPA